MYPKNKKNLVQDCILDLEGYTRYQTDQEKRGVIVYIANHLDSYQIDLESEFSEYLVCNIRLNNRDDITLGCIYRSPDSEEENNALLNSLLMEINNSIKHKHVCIMGDFNYKEINWDKNEVYTNSEHHAYHLFDTVNDLFLYENVRQPTRFRDGQNPSALDWVLTDKQDSISHLQVEPPLGKSDHGVISFNLDVSSNNTAHYCPYAYHRGDYNKIKNDMNDIDWVTELADSTIDEAWGLFSRKLSGAIERHIPKQKYKNRKKPPWLNRESILAIKEKHKTWNRYKKKPSRENWEAYTTSRNIATNKINQAKCNYEGKIAAEVKNNPKSFWSYVKSKTSSKGGIRELRNADNEIITQDNQKAILLNNYFTSVFTDEDCSEIPLPQAQTNSIIDDIEINEQTVLSKITKLNQTKSPGPDNIHPKVLYEVKEIVSLPLALIYNISLNQSKLPSDWKIANVSPIFKKGGRSKVQNYRPVSLTSVCCKILERIFRDPIFEHLENQGILTNDQHGFRQKRSCVTQLLEVMEIWLNIFDQGLAWDTIYMDFAKAFDRVPHNRLLAKIRSLGIRGKLLNWISDFLTNRKQRVVIGNSASPWTEVTSGIPQGSVLGPILFVMYINDLPNEVMSYIKIFADDTKIFRAIRSISDINKIQKDIDRLVAWSIKWQLYFNSSKCKVIHYGKNNPNHNYNINNSKLAEDDKEKDLGVLFDNKLTFQSHIRQICASANSRVGLIKKTFNNHSLSNIKLLHKSLVRPILEYGSVIWAPHLKKDIIEIEKIQKRMTKLVPELSNLPYKVRLQRMNLTTLEYRRKRADIIQIFRIAKGIDNLNFQDFFEVDTNRRTRGHRLKIRKTHCNTNKKLCAFPQRAINNWNLLPSEAIDCNTLNSFKSKIEKHWAGWDIKYEIPGLK